MDNENVAYCSRCDKHVKPDPGFECPVCESSLREETKSEEEPEETPEQGG